MPFQTESLAEIIHPQHEEKSHLTTVADHVAIQNPDTVNVSDREELKWVDKR